MAQGRERIEPPRLKTNRGTRNEEIADVSHQFADYEE
jgi:hypothetical protein